MSEHGMSRQSMSKQSMSKLRIDQDAECRERVLRLKFAARGDFTSNTADAVLARIIWCRLSEPGDATASALIEALGAATAASLVVDGAPLGTIAAAAREAGSELTPQAIGDGLKRWAPRVDRRATLADLDLAISRGLSVVTPDSAAWPERLDDLGLHTPTMLWVAGDPTVLSAFSLAVVGARACTGYGSHVTAELTDAACQAGCAIVSGAAYGVDAVAHRVALASEAKTVAVVAGGVDRVYPAAHAGLYERIEASGAVCSEMVPGTAPTRWRFLQRNRIIASLAEATLVTEAGARSGSLNTAGHAASLARQLGAVPGPVTSAASAGCHRLVREYGAMLITNGAQVRELLGLDDLLFDEAASAGDERAPSLHRRVIDALPLRGARPLEEVARLAGVSLEEAKTTLAELELLGSVGRHDGSTGANTAWKLLRRA